MERLREKAAKAMHEATFGSFPGWALLNDETRAGYRKHADAALAALGIVDDDTTPCIECGETYFERIGSYWLADDELWAEVMGDGCDCVVCPRCFARKAAEQGIPVLWQPVRAKASDLAFLATDSTGGSDG